MKLNFVKFNNGTTAWACESIEETECWGRKAYRMTGVYTEITTTYTKWDDKAHKIVDASIDSACRVRDEVVIFYPGIEIVDHVYREQSEPTGLSTELDMMSPYWLSYADAVKMAEESERKAIAAQDEWNDYTRKAPKPWWRFWS